MKVDNIPLGINEQVIFPLNGENNFVECRVKGKWLEGYLYITNTRLFILSKFRRKILINVWFRYVIDFEEKGFFTKHLLVKVSSASSRIEEIKLKVVERRKVKEILRNLIPHRTKIRYFYRLPF